MWRSQHINTYLFSKQTPINFKFNILNSKVKQLQNSQSRYRRQTHSPAPAAVSQQLPGIRDYLLPGTTSAPIYLTYRSTDVIYGDFLESLKSNFSLDAYGRPCDNYSVNTRNSPRATVYSALRTTKAVYDQGVEAYRILQGLSLRLCFFIPPVYAYNLSNALKISAG